MEWDQTTLPAGLRRAHRLGRGTWGRITVHSGRLHFKAATTPPIDVELGPGATQAIPPGSEHEVAPVGAVLVSLEFLTVDRKLQPSASEPETGPVGDPACWAGLVCPECGGVAGDGSGHRPGCSAGPARFS